MKYKLNKKKSNLLELSVLQFFILGFSNLQSQSLYINQSENTQSICSLSEIRKITFSSDNINILQTDNSTTNNASIGLNYLSFTNYSNINIENSKQASIYPNPVNNILNINLKNIGQHGIIHILSFDGKILKTQKIKDNNVININVSDLLNGIYLCHYSSPSVTKIIKFIKL